MDLEDSYIFQLNLLQEQKPFILIETVFCDRNENKSKDFTSNKFKISLKWTTKKVITFLSLKEKYM